VPVRKISDGIKFFGEGKAAGRAQKFFLGEEMRIAKFQRGQKV